MITSPSPLGPTPSGNDPAANSRKRVADLESQARLVEDLIPRFKDEHDRQFYREVVQSYRAVARDLLRRAWSDDKGQDIAEIRCHAGGDPCNRGGNHSACWLQR
jgi:hypothetical protein